LPLDTGTLRQLLHGEGLRRPTEELGGSRQIRLLHLDQQVFPYFRDLKFFDACGGGEARRRLAEREIAGGSL
jgi:hypothetical protein